MIALAVYLIGGLLFFLISVPFILNYAIDAEEAVMLGLASMCAAPMWPLAIPVLLIVWLGKVLGSF